jgi:hypothetical protein
MPDGGSDSGNDILSVGGGDGGQDAADAGMDVNVTPRYCQTSTIAINAPFCADFDIPNDAGAGFTSPSINGAFATSFETLVASSKPTAFEVDIPSDGGGSGTIEAFVGGTDSGAASMITLDLDIYLPAVSTIPTPSVFMFAFGSVGPASTQFGLAEVSEQWVFANQQGQTRALTIQPATGEWAHAQLAIILSTTGGTASITVTSSAGTSTASFVGVETTVASAPPYPAQLLLGVIDTVPPNTQSVYYDNAVINFQ